MAEKRVQFNTVVQNQLPAYVRDEFPLVSEFLKQYYIAQEFQGASVDLIQNIDKYVKVQEITNLNETVILNEFIDFDDTTITVDLTSSPKGTNGFPETYGLLKIDDEIITYTGKTDTSFTGCVRGFSGVSSYESSTKQDELVFESTTADSHDRGSTITNLSVLFLKEFLTKVKHQVLPGFENRDLNSELNQNLFIKQSKDFYSSRGTDRSFEILFKALYGEEVKIVKPRDYLITPSNAEYKVTNDLVVESVLGDPLDLELSTLYQDDYSTEITKAYGPITHAERIVSGIGQTFYKLSLDAGYNRDLIVNGAVYGNFAIHPKTRIIGNVSSGTTFIDVDSTVGFPNSGELYVTYNDGNSGVVTYTSKSLTQFLGIGSTGITATINDESSVGINTYAFGFSSVDPTQEIRVRINSVLSELEYPNDTKFYAPNDTGRIKTLGSETDDFVSSNWIFNTTPTYNVESVSLIDSSDQTWRINLTKKHYFREGDSLSVILTDGTSRNGSVVSVSSEKSFTIKGQGSLSTSQSYKVKRSIKKVQSTSFSNVSYIPANVQNVYRDGEKCLVASASIPFYNRQPLETTNREILFSGTFSENDQEIQLVFSGDHGFQTGDAVYYTPEIITESFFNDVGELATREVVDSRLFAEGLYFVTRVDQLKVKLSRTRTDAFNSRYVSVGFNTSVTGNKLSPYEFRFKSLEQQKLLREISTPQNGEETTSTIPGYTGILINGVEILNYKSKDSIFYGQVDEIEVTANGQNYDVINPPNLSIQDSIGYGATGNFSVSGSLKEIRIIDPGFDYVSKPVITISGGNGAGAVAEANMTLKEHSVSFNSDIASGQVTLGATQSTIGFSTYHKFRNAEKVIYDPQNQKGISGIITNSVYYVSTVGNTTVKLHPTEFDAISGINTVVLSDFGEGKHLLKSFNKKSVVHSINVVSPGSNYENKKRVVGTTGISTSLNQIEILNHGYSSGDVVRYDAVVSPVAGLSSGTDYYVTKIDDDNFKLSNVGLGTTNKDFYYVTKQYVNLTSVGSGSHTFNYPPITVSIKGEIGISSIGTETFEVSIQPIFRGEISSIQLTNKGVGYGSSEIINLNRPPLVSALAGENAQVQPIINNGQITDVIILSAGQNYASTPDLEITGDGVGAVLTPIIENNSLSSVVIVSGGAGYSAKNTSIEVKTAGKDASFKTNLQTWTINLFERHFNTFTLDDGFISTPTNEDNGLQYSHIYAPRKLRESVYSVDQSGVILYGAKDLPTRNGVEVSSNYHSPIIGWAYDGNPIYGPYGYSKKSGGIVSQMKSGYKLDLKSNRPPTAKFAPGFFVEDYTHNRVSDEAVLDENNGRFCVTPEYPNGTYAYFATVDPLQVDSSGPFLNYKRPIFPYLIGNTFKSAVNEFNFKKASNQNDTDLNQTNWKRNINPFNLIDDDITYDYLPIPNDLNQTVDVKATSPGSVDSLGISTGGTNYKVNDKVVFDNTGTRGYGASARVSRILGKSVTNVSVATSTIDGVEIYPSSNKGDYIIFSDNPHNFVNGDVIKLSGLSTTSSKIEGIYPVGISSNILKLAGVGTTSSGIGSIGETGIATYFNVQGNLNFPNVRENDILEIGTERVKVLNVDSKLSRIKVLRAINGTVGSSHTVSTLLYEDPRKLTVKVGFNTTYDYKLNKQIYFDPAESVGVGSTSGIGIGYTVFTGNTGAGATKIFIPTKTIYIKNHGLETGDTVTYSSNGTSGISGLVVLAEGETGTGTTLSDPTTLFIAKVSDDLIGLSTVRVGLGTTGTFVGIASTVRSSSTLFFTGVGIGNSHSLKTNYSSVITGQIERNLVTVSTAQTHGLSAGDNVYVDVNPLLSTSFSISYNDYNRKLLIDPKVFAASGVNTSSSSITIENHNFSTGQKVVHTSSSPAQGLQDNKVYFVVKVDDNTIKLSNNYYGSVQAKPSIVGIASTSGGTLSAVNPPLTVYKNSTVSFAVSDSSLSFSKQGNSYSAFELNFYLDEKFTKKYDKSSEGTVFDVQRSGLTGITSTSTVTLTIDEETPSVLYYKLDPLYEANPPVEKTEVNVDDEVLSNNRIIVNESGYSGDYNVSIAATNSFTYNVKETPEQTSYSPSTSLLSYETSSTSALGPISQIEILNKGFNYYSVPGITTISSNLGSGAIINATSSSAGRIKKIKINDIGFDFPSDKTVSPLVGLPQILTVTPLSSFDSIGITSFGRGYSVAPKLVVYDGKTNELVTDVDLQFKLNDNQIKILKNTSGINNTTPRIVPIQNSNGVGISTIRYNSTTKSATVVLAVGFSTADTFPFNVNDKVLIENVSVGVGSTAKGFNSENYKHRFFNIESVTPNIGGIGTVSFNLTEFLESGEVPGTFDEINSISARIIPVKYTPLFNVTLKPNNFIVGERVTSNSASGIVEDWDSKIEQIKISTSDTFVVDELIRGESSNTQGIPSSVISFDSNFKLNPATKVESGWQSNSGFLNQNLQRIQDSLYYQNFSYSLRSRVNYDTWNNAVSALNHTAGFKKFSDYQLETPRNITEINENSLAVGISTDQTSIEVVSELSQFINLNCVFDYDLVSENSITIGSRTLSNEITFASRILSDFFESIGNRVLSIDDISVFFNSNPRTSRYSIVNTFRLADVRSQKYINLIKDSRFTGERQLLIVDIVHDDSLAYVNQYGRVETQVDLGSFDFAISGDEGQLLFYPTKYSVNDYNVTSVSYNLNDNLLSVGNTSIGDIVTVQTSSVTSVGIASTTIVSIASTYRSVKVLVSAADFVNNEYEFDELNIIHDGTDVYMTDYGQVTTSIDDGEISGFGTYVPYLDGSNLIVDFIPNNVGLALTINTIQVAIATESPTGIATVDLKHARIQSGFTSVTSSGSPGINTVITYPAGYDAAYFVVQISDTTNNRYQMSEFVVVDDYEEGTSSGDTYDVEYGNVETSVGLGTLGTRVSSAGTVELLYTPLAGIDAEVRVYMNALKIQDDDKDIISFNNGTIETNFGSYTGTENTIRRSFDLKHKTSPIFEKYFVGSSSTVVDVTQDTISIPNHFFVSGQKVTYNHQGTEASAIGIASTSFDLDGSGVGLGTTSFLPSNVFVIKVDEDTIRLASSATNALKLVPEYLDIESVGVGTSHRFIAQDQNTKCIVTIDNVIQSPIVSTAITQTLARNITTVDDVIFFSGITSFFGADTVKVNDEIMKIRSVGFGSTNAFLVRRGWFGTEVGVASTGALVTKIEGNYNIINSVITFSEPPYGPTPVGGGSSNPPDERDWTGIATGSSFHGRTFLRTGVIETTRETYSDNYIFDDISQGFDGTTRSFELTENQSNVTGITTTNAVLLINNVFQTPGNIYDYELNEIAGVTTVRFTGTATSIFSDVNTSNVPVGGIIVSVGSTEGFGYQPLVAAGGTAIISGLGTISSVSIGNSGSGYRVGVQTVNVSVGTSSLTGINRVSIGTAVISAGHIVSVAITNPGTGYTTSNPPDIFFDSPLSYSNLDLEYSSSSVGAGQSAKVNVVVGQGSSVIDFEITNTGFAYGVGEILTVPTGGLAGIPTDPTKTFKEFNLTIQRLDKDDFSGWSLGTLQVLDDVMKYANGNRLSFPLSVDGNPVSIVAAKGSNIDVQDVLLIFVNDILQVPGKGYTFEGGSEVTFSEPLKNDPENGAVDRVRIIFYKGTGDNDVVLTDITESVKVGDELTIGYDSSVGQKSYLQEETRNVNTIKSTNVVTTNPYYGPGNVSDTNLLRPVVWCRQTEDKIIDEKEVGKDRPLYEPRINPYAYITRSVGVGSTQIYVDNVRPFFDPQNESATSPSTFQNKVKFISQDSKVSASATAVVSGLGTISSIEITDGGVGYSTTPTVSIASTVGIATTTQATATATISVGGTVSSITITGAGVGYTNTNPPVVLITPPSSVEEDNSVTTFVGDSGIIVGFGTTSVGVGSTQVIFDLHIPYNSFLRESDITGFAGITTLSSLDVSDYFIVYNTNVGYASTTLTSLDSTGGTVGVATVFVDGVYFVDSAEYATVSVAGVTTTVRRIFARVSEDFVTGTGSGISTSNYFGNYSWGKVSLSSRQYLNSYTAYTSNGVTGLTTSLIVQRFNQLKSSNYTT